MRRAWSAQDLQSMGWGTEKKQSRISPEPLSANTLAWKSHGTETETVSSLTYRVTTKANTMKGPKHNNKDLENQSMSGSPSPVKSENSAWALQQTVEPYMGGHVETLDCSII
jgi:hypothetical protein